MIVRLDHVMLLTGDVPAAQQDFAERLGLRARYGGVHPRGTHNALIHFPGGLAYLEIFGPRDEAEIRSHGNTAALDWIARGGGVWRFAVGTDDVDAAHARANAQGAAAADVGDWNRARPDGSVVRWRMFGIAQDDQPRAFPFIIQWAPDEPRTDDLRDAGFIGEAPLGATAFERISVVTPDVDELAARYEAIYGVDVGPAVKSGRLGASVRAARLAKEGVIELCEPTGEGPTKAALDALGSGAFRITLAVGDLVAAHGLLAENGVASSGLYDFGDGRRAFLIDSRDAHGAAIEVVQSQSART